MDVLQKADVMFFFFFSYFTIVSNDHNDTIYKLYDLIATL